MKKLRKQIFLILLMFALIDGKAQTMEPILLTEIDTEKTDEEVSENNIHSKRDLELLSILPVVQYDTEAESIIIESLHVSFTSVTYCITDENDAVLTGNEIDLPRNCEHNIPLSHLPQGTYYIVLEIDGIRFTGEFEKF